MKDLLCIHLNEFNRKYLLDKGKKYNKKNILSFFNKFENYIETYSVDKIQDKNLDPWVQSVTINTGKTSSNHKIYKIGQGVPKKTMQIWDILTKKKIKSGVWGTMNSILKKNKYLNFYYPDPWNYNSKTYPQNLESFLNLPRYYAQNYTSYNKLTILRYIIIFFIKLIFTNFPVFFLKNIKKFCIAIFSYKLRNYSLFCLFDIISLILCKDLIKKNETKFALIFLNSIAHFQHNNWDNLKEEKNFFHYLDIIFDLLNTISLSYKSILLINGFTQKKIATEFLIRPKNANKFLKKLNIKFVKLEQDMTTGGFLYFKNKNELKKNKDQLDKINIRGIKLFKNTKYGDKRLYYKIHLTSYTQINSDNYKNINKQNLKKYFNYQKIDKLNLDLNYELDRELLNELAFIKTTGKHFEIGDLFYKNLDIKKQKKIHNAEIYSIIKKHFI